MSEESENVVHGSANLSGGGGLSADGFANQKLAAKWFEDAFMEARKKPPSFDTKRREIIFATCCVESYLLEWTLATVMNVARPDRTRMSATERLEEVFPNKVLGVEERWKKVINKLIAIGLIPAKPDFGPKGEGHDEEWTRLLNYRNDLNSSTPHGK